MRHVGPLLVCATAWLLLPSGAAAQGRRTGSVAATFVVASQARMSLSAATLTFVGGDPDLSSRIPASEGPIAVTVKMRSVPGSTVVLTVQASDDLRSSLSTIGISALAWTASGVGFVSGTVSRNAQTVGSWTASGAVSGALTFSLLNSWTYASGSYGTTLTYTLTAP